MKIPDIRFTQRSSNHREAADSALGPQDSLDSLRPQGQTAAEVIAVKLPSWEVEQSGKEKMLEVEQKQEGKELETSSRECDSMQTRSSGASGLVLPAGLCACQH